MDTKVQKRHYEHLRQRWMVSQILSGSHTRIAVTINKDRSILQAFKNQHSTQNLLYLKLFVLHSQILPVWYILKAKQSVKVITLQGQLQQFIVFFFFLIPSPSGPDAPLHSLPEGAPPPGRPDNNSLAPSKKVNRELKLDLYLMQGVNSSPTVD